MESIESYAQRLRKATVQGGCRNEWARIPKRVRDVALEVSAINAIREREESKLK